jgi:hypothetical protein
MLVLVLCPTDLVRGCLSTNTMLRTLKIIDCRIDWNLWHAHKAKRGIGFYSCTDPRPKQKRKTYTFCMADGPRREDHWTELLPSVQWALGISGNRGGIHTSSYLETSTFFLFSSVATCILVNKEQSNYLGNSIGIIGWNSFSHEGRPVIVGIIDSRMQGTGGRNDSSGQPPLKGLNGLSGRFLSCLIPQVPTKQDESYV